MRKDGKEPAAFQKDGLGNFYHVGLYIGDGKVIESQSKNTGVVVTAVSKWGYAARLKDTEYDLAEGDSPTTADTLSGKVATSGGSLNLRSKPSSSGVILVRIPNGTALTLTKQGEDWYSTSYNGKTGYVSAAFIALDHGITYTLTGTTASEAIKNKLVQYAQTLGVIFTVTGGERM